MKLLKHQKQITALLLLIAMSVMFVCPTYAAVNTEGIVSPQYTTGYNATADISISSTGYTIVTVRAQAATSLESISAITYLERNVYGMWVRVDIGTTNNEWTCSCSNGSLAKAYTTTLSASGQYRVVSIVTITGDTVESITATDFTSF